MDSGTLSRPDRAAATVTDYEPVLGLQGLGALGSPKDCHSVVAVVRVRQVGASL